MKGKHCVSVAGQRGCVVVIYGREEQTRRWCGPPVRRVSQLCVCVWVEENGEDVRGPIVRRRRLYTRTEFAEPSRRRRRRLLSLTVRRRRRRRARPPGRVPDPSYSPLRPPATIDFEGNWYRALRTAPAPGSSSHPSVSHTRLRRLVV